MQQGIEYQIIPYNYYVKDFFLAKSLLYVLGYMSDDILFHVAIDEAASKYKIKRADIIDHIQNIRSLTLGEMHAVSESGSELL